MSNEDFESNLSDRELLVLIADRTRSMRDQLADHESRLRLIEGKQQTQTGQFQGAGKLWALLSAVPAGILGYLINQHN